MLQNVKRITRYLILPVYLLLFFLGVVNYSLAGYIANAVLCFIGIWAYAPGFINWRGYLLCAIILAFYTLLYATEIFSVPAGWLGLPGKWTFYGLLYSLLVIGFGIEFMIKKRRDRYQVVRTISVMVVQLFFAFLIPMLMQVIAGFEYYFSYLWPLELQALYPANILALPYPLPFLLYALIGSLVVFPLLALLLGKRFYCSWVCGCGGLAETFGDRWRHLSDKSRGAWRYEKASIYSVLVFAVVTTLLVFANWLLVRRGTTWLEGPAGVIENFYAYVIKFALAGAIGVAAYPVLGSRVWCRFFCPMAAMLGLLQLKGRFHIHVKKGMCISCGMCSRYCEMGIDVRDYAQNDTSFTRASCVGCGLCSNVCPRGVLRLENKKGPETKAAL